MRDVALSAFLSSLIRPTVTVNYEGMGLREISNEVGLFLILCFNTMIATIVFSFQPIKKGGFFLYEIARIAVYPADPRFVACPLWKFNC